MKVIVPKALPYAILHILKGFFRARLLIYFLHAIQSSGATRQHQRWCSLCGWRHTHWDRCTHCQSQMLLVCAPSCGHSLHFMGSIQVSCIHTYASLHQHPVYTHTCTAGSEGFLLHHFIFLALDLNSVRGTHFTLGFGPSQLSNDMNPIDLNCNFTFLDTGGGKTCENKNRFKTGSGCGLLEAMVCVMWLAVSQLGVWQSANHVTICILGPRRRPLNSVHELPLRKLFFSTFHAYYEVTWAKNALASAVQCLQQCTRLW